MRDKAASVLAKALSTNRILWAGFIGAVIVYGLMLEVVARSGSGLRGTPVDLSRVERMPLSEDPLLVLIVLAAAGVAALGRLVPKLLLTPQRLRAAAAGEAREDLRMERQLGKADLEAIAALPETERRPFHLLGSWSTACILQWAAYEAVGVLGLVLAHLRGSDPWVFAPFGAVAIALLLTAKPDLEELHRLARSPRL